MSKLTEYLLGALAALFIVAWQGAALGASLDGSAGQSVTVRYADLDLNRPADVKTLYQRIRHAAYGACGERELTGSHLPLPSWQTCVRDAVDQAVAQLDRPALTAYHREHSEAARKG
ncbi:MAG TPA: UrcA family protein [Steroidobacteraceae bacterium]|jgi:UrcA family protein